MRPIIAPDPFQRAYVPITLPQATSEALNPDGKDLAFFTSDLDWADASAIGFLIYWWLHAMMLVWTFFTLTLFVLEPLFPHRRLRWPMA